jgi:hypothetical protein
MVIKLIINDYLAIGLLFIIYYYGFILFAIKPNFKLSQYFIIFVIIILNLINMSFFGFRIKLFIILYFSNYLSLIIFLLVIIMSYFESTVTKCFHL